MDNNRYNWRYPDAEDQAGVPGKGGNANPPSLFATHTFLRYKVGAVTTWFDPNYGLTNEGRNNNLRTIAFQENLAGYYIDVLAKVSEVAIGGIDINGDGLQNDAERVPCSLIVMINHANQTVDLQSDTRDW